MTLRNFLPLLIVASHVASCQSSPYTPTNPTPPASASIAAQPSSPAQSALDAMDRRTPVPLLPMMANHQKQNMRDHLLAVQEIVAAVAAKDFDAVQTSVSRMGYSEQMGQMCQHMGAGAPSFTELALKFHHGADQIGDAAKRQDAQAVLEALSNTLATCTACHQTYKQQLVDAAAWTALTKMPSPSGSMHP